MLVANIKKKRKATKTSEKTRITEVPTLMVLRDSGVVNSSGSWFHSLIFDGENNISYLRQSYVFKAPTYGDGQG